MFVSILGLIWIVLHFSLRSTPVGFSFIVLFSADFDLLLASHLENLFSYIFTASLSTIHFGGFLSYDDEASSELLSVSVRQICLVYVN